MKILKEKINVIMFFEEIKKCCLSINPSEIIYLGENGRLFQRITKRILYKNSS